MEKKTDIYKHFEKWKLKAEKDTEKKLQTIRVNNEGEYNKLKST